MKSKNSYELSGLRCGYRLLLASRLALLLVVATTLGSSRRRASQLTEGESEIGRPLWAR